MQNALVDFNASKQEQDRVYVRIGVHYGAGIVKSNDVFGDVVNVASRVESVASPEQIVISDTLHEQVRDCGLHILGLGRFVLKGKEGERNLFEVIWDPRIANRPAASHTIVTGGAKFTHLAPYKLLQLRRDGSIAVEYELKDIFTIGRAEGDVEFPSDSKLAPVHARFVLESGQVFVEDLSQGGSVYVRLVGPYTLAHEDTILMGRQLLQFHEQADVMTAAAAVGGTVVDATAVLSEPVAELVLLSPSTAPQRFPIDEEQVTFGRTRGTYTFPDDGVMSRAHARIYQRGEDFYLEDTASRNGTFIKVRGRAPVPLGAVVLMGGQLFQLAQ
jgi:pSer/pThr/pTyr-binding forkhead associated (FHA) protein